ncbi:MAG: hypothetical protein AAC990_04940 [Dehalococcoides mccartyi]|uniref:DUF2292 domain-containing protein n=1 Tax=Dehalococcoides mccartyi TaxID=61435 RepID=A0A142V9Z1_9CHLR|nr:hypothetical protein [Dehalococcoides mccartyi]AGG07957.1 hypothetical protein btf_870 [Dehalococcoides mccartyi BTF08]AMU86654.1 hypothetical protein Dm11a5_0828 [Dehalococcoides mccartyi]
MKEITQQELAEVTQALQAVKESGFGEVRIGIRNGYIYQVSKTDTKILELPKN